MPAQVTELLIKYFKYCGRGWYYSDSNLIVLVSHIVSSEQSSRYKLKLVFVTTDMDSLFHLFHGKLGLLLTKQKCILCGYLVILGVSDGLDFTGEEGLRA